jgi:hypothetical protein
MLYDPFFLSKFDDKRDNIANFEYFGVLQLYAIVDLEHPHFVLIKLYDIAHLGYTIFKFYDAKLEPPNVGVIKFYDIAYLEYINDGIFKS